MLGEHIGTFCVSFGIQAKKSWKDSLFVGVRDLSVLAAGGQDYMESFACATGRGLSSGY